MHISLGRSTYALGEPVLIDIEYLNPTTQSILRDDPAKSLDVVMHAQDVAAAETMEYSMGSVTVTMLDRAADRYVLVDPAPTSIEISPGESRRFTSDMNERLYLHPGRFDCFLVDGETVSNRVPISIVYDRRAVDFLLHHAMDITAGYGRREWAMDWLRKLRPEFLLDLPLDEDPAPLRAGKEHDNRAQGDAFRQWWQQARATISLPASPPAGN